VTPAFIQRARQVIRLAEPPRWAQPSIIVLGLLGAALEGLSLYLFIPLLQSLGAGGDDHLLSRAFERLLAPIQPDLRAVVIVAALCAAVLGKNIVTLVGGYVARLVDGLVAHDLRARIFDQALSACVDYRADARLTDVTTTLTNNTWKVSNALSIAYRLVICTCTFLVFGALLMAISWRLTLLALTMLGIAAAVVHLLTRRAHALGHAVVEENRNFGLRMWESMSLLQLIRSFGREEFERRRFVEQSERVRRRILSLDIMWALPGPIAEIFATLLIGALVLVGAATGAGLAPLGAFLAVLYRIQGPTREFLQCKVALDGLGAAVDDVDQFLADTSRAYIASGSAPAYPPASEIEFREVSFRYQEGEPLALDAATFTIPAGKTTALVGRSGGGKSTLLSMLLRFRDPESGEILVDGRPLREFDVASWRLLLSVMSQEAQIFNDTAAANIRYGDLDASEAEVIDAATIAGADAFIEAMPQGYETILGDGGARLSGGQRQRIALARTILRSPSVLLLDEPTNALDAETEQAFQAALRTFAQGRTVVVIAHRLSTVMSADQVVVMEDGRVVEAGPPAELLARPGRFAQLHGLQQGGPREEAA
jgi:subfamily B ATP-binding cassette protein MsbA